MAGTQISVLAMFKAKSGLEERVREELSKLVAPTRAESGCINYDLHQCSDDKSKFMLYENWVSKKDLDVHLEMPHLNHFIKMISSNEITCSKMELFFQSKQIW